MANPNVHRYLSNFPILVHRRLLLLANLSPGLIIEIEHEHVDGLQHALLANHPRLTDLILTTNAIRVEERLAVDAVHRHRHFPHLHVALRTLLLLLARGLNLKSLDFPSNKQLTSNRLKPDPFDDLLQAKYRRVKRENWK